jgi:hypothetical protein
LHLWANSEADGNHDTSTPSKLPNNENNDMNKLEKVCILCIKKGGEGGNILT